MLSQRCDYLFSARCSPQPGEATQYRQICFTRTMMFETLSADDKNASHLGRLLQKFLDGRSLSHPRLSGHEHDLAFACERAIKPATHFRQVCVSTKHSARVYR